MSLYPQTRKNTRTAYAERVYFSGLLRLCPNPQRTRSVLDNTAVGSGYAIKSLNNGNVFCFTQSGLAYTVCNLFVIEIHNLTVNMDTGSADFFLQVQTVHAGTTRKCNICLTIGKTSVNVTNNVLVSLSLWFMNRNCVCRKRYWRYAMVWHVPTRYL